MANTTTTTTRKAKLGFGREISRVTALRPISKFVLLAGVAVGLFLFFRRRPA